MKGGYFRNDLEFIGPQVGWLCHRGRGRARL